MEIKFADNAGLIVIGALLSCSVLFPEFAQALGRLIGKKINVQWRTKTRIGVGIFGGALMLVGVLLSFRGTSVDPPIALTPTNTAIATPVSTTTLTMPSASADVPSAPPALVSTIATPTPIPIPTPCPTELCGPIIPNPDYPGYVIVH